MIAQAKERKGIFMNEVFFKRLQLVAVVLLVVVSAALLGAGFLLDGEYFSGQQQDQSARGPYVEITEFDGEVPLVGDLVIEWLKGEKSGEEIYKNNAAEGRVYISQTPMLYFSVFNLPEDVAIQSQELLLSQKPDFSDAKRYEVPVGKRYVYLPYLFVNTTYYCKVQVLLEDGQRASAQTSFKTMNTPRIIDIDGTWNTRDIGGRTTLDGKVIKQGLFYRGTELDGLNYHRYVLSEQGKAVMLDELKIKTELDFREPKEKPFADMLGDQVAHESHVVLAYSDFFLDFSFEGTRQAFSLLAKKEAYPIYAHCTYGKDRTGTFVYLLDLLLGMDEKEAYRQWDLSVLADGVSGDDMMNPFMADFKKLPGETMQQKAENYLISLGVTRQEIEAIRDILLETPAK